MGEVGKGPKPLRIMVLGAEMKRIIAPMRVVSGDGYALHFEPFDTPKRLAEYDGAIVFQGTFEMREEYHRLGNTYVTIKSATNQLHSRIKEVHALLNAGGFVCLVLCEPFIDEDSSGDTRQTDLVKYFLSGNGIYRRNFDSRVPQVRSMMSEFQPFFAVWGAATAWFDIDERYTVRNLATAQDRLVGMILNRRVFCVPSQLPETPDGNRTPRAREYFELLATALVAAALKLQVEIPEWANAFSFAKERDALAKQQVLREESARVAAEIDAYRRYKWILIYDGDDLVNAVEHVFETGFGFKVDSVDEFREDLKLLDDQGAPFLFMEVKGTSRGVKREDVNQADTHRERANLPDTFPSVLIMNTAIKKAGSLADKDEEVAGAQVEHAKRHNILILRTIDLLRLLGQRDRGAVTSQDVKRLLTTGAGWLKVSDDAVELRVS